MKNVESIVKEKWFREKPWLILGTGPTLDQFKPEYLEQYNIWCIYSSIDVSGYADVFHYQDIDKPLYEQLPDNYRYVLIRPRFDVHPERSIVVEYDCDIAISKKRYSEGKIYPCSNSTSFAFMFLTSNGIKRIHTLGINFSGGICDKISPIYIQTTKYAQENVHGGETWDLENASNAHWCKLYKAKWIKLDK